MLLSMTGFGEARLQDDRRALRAEIRSVNNRHLKLTCKLSESLSAHEPELERLVRDKVRRGSVQLVVRAETPAKAEDFRLNQTALRSYRDQLLAFLDGGPEPPDFLSAIVGLPGVVESSRASGEEDASESWPAVSTVVGQAIEAFQKSRATEGRAMQAELLAMGSSISGHLARVADRGPLMIEGYRDRLLERVQGLVSDKGIALQPSDLIREVAIFAERSDIAEEITRLRAHLEQFDQVVRNPNEDAAGRKLEFIVQEMGRETNTIGSKSNDVAISREVVEIKGYLEKIRELIQNIE